MIPQQASTIRTAIASVSICKYSTNHSQDYFPFDIMRKNWLTFKICLYKKIFVNFAVIIICKDKPENSKIIYKVEYILINGLFVIRLKILKNVGLLMSPDYESETETIFFMRQSCSAIYQENSDRSKKC